MHKGKTNLFTIVWGEEQILLCLLRLSTAQNTSLSRQLLGVSPHLPSNSSTLWTLVGGPSNSVLMLSPWIRFHSEGFSPTGCLMSAANHKSALLTLLTTLSINKGVHILFSPGEKWQEHFLEFRETLQAQALQASFMSNNLEAMHILWLKSL